MTNQDQLQDKLKKAKQVFRHINKNLETLVTSNDYEKRVLVRDLKTINEEICEQVIELIKTKSK